MQSPVQNLTLSQHSKLSTGLGSYVLPQPWFLMTAMFHRKILNCRPGRSMSSGHYSCSEKIGQNFFHQNSLIYQNQSVSWSWWDFSKVPVKPRLWLGMCPSPTWLLSSQPGGLQGTPGFGDPWLWGSLSGRLPQTQRSPGIPNFLFQIRTKTNLEILQETELLFSTQLCWRQQVGLNYRAHKRCKQPLTSLLSELNTKPILLASLSLDNFFKHTHHKTHT